MSVETPSSHEEKSATQLLDGQCDTNGLQSFTGNADDWTDVKHSERKTRDRLLDDNVLLELIRKSDYEGFKRLFTNLAILFSSVYVVHLTLTSQLLTTNYASGADGDNAMSSSINSFVKIILLPPLYLFYGFQIQCLGYAAQHELMHRTAFRTRQINDALLFLVSIPAFEFGIHERLMHKQHHTYTNNIDKDPELTSYYTRMQLTNPEFRKVSYDRWEYVLDFVDMFSIVKSHGMRLVNSARGIAVDYTGTGWSLKGWTYASDSGIEYDLKKSARLQILFYVMAIFLCSRINNGIKYMFIYWIIPAILGFAPINFVRNAEHADCEISTEMNCLKNTRSCRSNFIVRHLMWNMNYHAEHHLYPMVPFYNLPKLHELLEGHLQHGDIKHFTETNWAYAKPGGWIDKQRSALDIEKKD